MIEESAMLIVGNDEQCAFPLFGVLGKYLIDIPEKMFSSPNTRGRVVIIRRPAKMDGRIGVLRLDEYYLRHFRRQLGCHISRKLPETAEVGTQYFFKPVKQ